LIQNFGFLPGKSAQNVIGDSVPDIRTPDADAKTNEIAVTKSIDQRSDTVVSAMPSFLLYF
jgi:hypothetical protein